MALEFAMRTHSPDGRTRQTGCDGDAAAYRAILDFLEATLRHVPSRLAAMSADLPRIQGVTIVHETPAPASH